MRQIPVEEAEVGESIFESQEHLIRREVGYEFADEVAGRNQFGSRNISCATFEEGDMWAGSTLRLSNLGSLGL